MEPTPPPAARSYHFHANDDDEKLYSIYFLHFWTSQIGLSSNTRKVISSRLFVSEKTNFWNQ